MYVCVCVLNKMANMNSKKSILFDGFSYLPPKCFSPWSMLMWFGGGDVVVVVVWLDLCSSLLPFNRRNKNRNRNRMFSTRHRQTDRPTTTGSQNFCNWFSLVFLLKFPFLFSGAVYAGNRSAQYLVSNLDLGRQLLIRSCLWVEWLQTGTKVLSLKPSWVWSLVQA